MDNITLSTIQRVNEDNNFVNNFNNNNYHKLIDFNKDSKSITDNDSEIIDLNDKYKIEQDIDSNKANINESIDNNINKKNNNNNQDLIIKDFKPEPNNT